MSTCEHEEQPTLPNSATAICPLCGRPMRLASIRPHANPSRVIDEHTFDCTCGGSLMQTKSRNSTA